MAFLLGRIQVANLRRKFAGRTGDAKINERNAVTRVQQFSTKKTFLARGVTLLFNRHCRLHAPYCFAPVQASTDMKGTGRRTHCEKQGDQNARIISRGNQSSVLPHEHERQPGNSILAMSSHGQTFSRPVTTAKLSIDRQVPSIDRDRIATSRMVRAASARFFPHRSRSACYLDLTAVSKAKACRRKGKGAYKGKPGRTRDTG